MVFSTVQAVCAPGIKLLIMVHMREMGICSVSHAIVNDVMLAVHPASWHTHHQEKMIEPTDVPANGCKCDIMVSAKPCDQTDKQVKLGTVNTDRAPINAGMVSVFLDFSVFIRFITLFSSNLGPITKLRCKCSIKSLLLCIAREYSLNWWTKALFDMGYRYKLPVLWLFMYQTLKSAIKLTCRPQKARLASLMT